VLPEDGGLHGDPLLPEGGLRAGSGEGLLQSALLPPGLRLRRRKSVRLRPLSHGKRLAAKPPVVKES
jgi:hypothetical protein